MYSVPFRMPSAVRVMTSGRICLATLLSFVLLAGCADKSGDYSSQVAEDTPPNTLTQAEIEAGWELLFDGTSTAGWHGYNRSEFPTKGWLVEDGKLIVVRSGTEEAGFGGDIVTDASYGNFELSLDFAVTDTVNSGIFYRVIEEEDSAIWHNAPEFQVLDDSTYLSMDPDGMATHLTGDNYDLHSASVRPTKPVGEWNTARIVVDGSHVEHWLNGQKTVEYELWSPEWEEAVANSKFAEYPAYGRTQQGPIGLQDHGHTVSFRNIKIRAL